MRFVSGSLGLKTFLSRWRPRGPEFVFPRVHPRLALGFFFRVVPLLLRSGFFSALGPGFFLFSVMALAVRRLRFLDFLSADVSFGPSVLHCP